MIPGVGAALRLGRGLQQRRQIEARIRELEELWDKPAASHYEGVKRFEVATVLCDARLGRILAHQGDPERRRRAAQAYSEAMEAEYRMALSQASATPATKAEVYALGLALKEVALSFGDAREEFLAAVGTNLARLDAELGRVRNESAAVMADFSEASRIEMERVRLVTEGALSELAGSLDGRVAAAERGLVERLREFDELVAAKSQESSAALTEARAVLEATVAAVEQQMALAMTRMGDDVAGRCQELRAAAARAEARTAGRLRTLVVLMVAMGLVVFVAAVAVGRF